jgi:hypothetical protein
MAISFTVPTLELGVERSDQRRIRWAIDTLPDEGYALLRSAGLGYRVVSRPELSALIDKMSSSGDRLKFTIADPISTVVRREEIQDHFHSLSRPYGRVIAINPAGSEIAHDTGLAPAPEAALALNLADFSVASLSDADLVVPPLGGGLTLVPYPVPPPWVPCPLLRPALRPRSQPFLERDHKFVHNSGFSVCLLDGEVCRHATFHRIPDLDYPLHAHCGRCGSTRL